MKNRGGIRTKRIMLNIMWASADGKSGGGDVEFEKR